MHGLLADCLSTAYALGALASLMLAPLLVTDFAGGAVCRLY
jgi:hypothetical protein